MINTNQTLRGFATISYWADDMEAAKAWYSDLLGIAPYFERSGPDGKPAYAEFRVGDYQHELGLIDRRFAPAQPTFCPGGAIMYWHVDDIEATLSRLKSMGPKNTNRSPTAGMDSLRHPSPIHSATYLASCTMLIT